MSLSKPRRLTLGDAIASISPCHGWAGDAEHTWKYKLGVKRLAQIGLEVIPAPHSMRGTDYLRANPQARAEDIMWAFENKAIRGIIANIGGNDSIKVVPHISTASIKKNHKIMIGFSDVVNIHYLCYKCGLSTFYGDNLLSGISEQQGWHEYSRTYFQKTLFDPSEIGVINPANNWTFESGNLYTPDFTRKYYPNTGYRLIQGDGVVRGELIGGHTGMIELDNTEIELTKHDFAGKILFLEEIRECFTSENLIAFFRWLGRKGALNLLSGIVMGKIGISSDLSIQYSSIISVIMNEYSLPNLPILSELNFGHTSPTFALPYGRMAEIDCCKGMFSIIEGAVT